MLQGQTVIVTGAAIGIGRYIARTFAKEGARLAICDIDTKRLHEATVELQGLGSEVMEMTADVRKEDDVHRFMSGTAARFGQIDVLINNAAIVTHFLWGIPRWPRLRDMDFAFWDKVMQTNLGGAFLCTKHVLPYMEERRSGHIINLYGGAGGPGAFPYGVSKDAIRSFTRFIAEEEKEWNICVVIVHPGAAIATEDAPEEARLRMPGPDFVGNRFVLAAETGMENTGQLLNVLDGRLQVVS